MITSSVFLIKEKVFEIETSTLINQNKKCGIYYCYARPAVTSPSNGIQYYYRNFNI